MALLWGAILFALPSHAQNQGMTITGKVLDGDGNSIPGVTVVVRGTTNGTSSDANGDYTLRNVPKGSVLEFRFLGYTPHDVTVGGQTEINAILIEQSESLEEVTVVAFGRQKKESVISSISTVNTRELRVPSSNLTTALAGRIAGVISYQTSGEPGQDNADFFIRGITTFGAGKVDPLILIDNVEMSKDDLSRLHPDDIQSFSILKDATATALYGARGANGVILITTKEGKEGKVKVSLRLENSFSSPTSQIEMADPITYMYMANEAALTRNPAAQTPYSNYKIENTQRGTNPYFYPAVDWLDMLTKKMATNQRANLNISGGGQVARYYIAASFSQDNGILKSDKFNDFKNNIDLKKYLIRSNININLTKTTEAIVRVHGTFDDYNGPTVGGSDLYKKSLQVSPVRFPAFYPRPESGVYSNSRHILFGGFDTDEYYNPYADMVKGFRQENKTVMMAQFELKQDFGKWVEGLSARILGNTTRNSSFDFSRAYSPFFYRAYQYDKETDTYRLEELNQGQGSEYLKYTPGYKNVKSSFYAEAAIAYNRKFKELHNVNGMLVGILRNEINGNAATLVESLPHRNLGLSGRFTYDYDSRYFAEFNFGYNGSEKFDKGHRWGFFPSFGVGWVASNEKFWAESAISNVVSKMKIRATYGLVGNDEIGKERFFYLSRVNIGAGGGFQTGSDFSGINRRGVSVSNYANSEIGWEIAHKTNIGLEVGLFDGKIEIIADLFHEYRTNILQERTDIPVESGLWARQFVNFGKATGQGIDVSVDYNHVVNPDFWITGRANFTYARSEYDAFEEPDYSKTPWKSRIGTSVGQQFGYIAERLFIDQADIDNSARQDFGEYKPGDIKYKDLNTDGVINELDMAPIGRPTTPEINYGFGLSMGYKNFDFSFFFQGSARSSFWIDAASMSPFRQHKMTGDNRIYETGVAKFIADDYWSELSQDPNAAWPRLSNYVISNNNQRSTWFMKNGDFLRLKSVEIGYSLPRKWLNKIKLDQIRIYASGTNLFCLSDFKLWDVEMGGNGLNYPLQRVINLGLNLSF